MHLAIHREELLGTNFNIILEDVFMEGRVYGNQNNRVVRQLVIKIINCLQQIRVHGRVSISCGSPVVDGLPPSANRVRPE